MSYEPVDIFVKTPGGNPIEGALVKIFDATGSTPISQAVTNSSGSAGFLLDTHAYSMRLFAYQTEFEQPQQLVILPAPTRNIFDVTGIPFSVPTSTDPRLCKCSGFFRNINGTPYAYLDLHVIAEFEPVLLGDNAVIPTELRITTTREGYAEIDLIKGGNYWVNIEAMGALNVRRLCRIPTLPSASLTNLLFPRVANVTFDPVAPYTIAVGETLELTPCVHDSVDRPMTGTVSDDLFWKLAETVIGQNPNAIANLTVNPDVLTITGLSSGIVDITAVRKDTTIIRIPDTSINGLPVRLQVT